MTIQELPDQSSVGASLETPVPSRSSGRWCRRLASRLGWPLLYLATISAIIWWYEIGSGVLLSRDIQGEWREVQGESHAEEFTNTHFVVDGGETWFLFPRDDAWNVKRSRISIKPAKNFYLVTREFGFDWGKNTKTTQYIMYRRGDQLFLLYGLARLDPSRQRSVTKLRRVGQVPGKAADAIDAYLIRNGDDS